MNKPAIVTASAVSALVLAAGVGVGIASADPTSTPSPTAPGTSTTTAAKPHQVHAHRGLVQRALHGEVTLGAKKPHVVDFQRGTVSEVSATSVTVASADGFTATYVVDAGTKVHKQKSVAAIGDVKSGDRVRVVALKAGSTVTAKRIGDAGTK